MKKISTILISLLLILIFGCNRVLLPLKSRVLYQKDGYIFERNNNLVFIPMNSKYNFFDTNNALDGFRINQNNEYQDIKNLYADTIKILTTYLSNNSSEKIEVEENVFLTRVRLIYAPFETKRIINKDELLKFKYRAKIYFANIYIPFKGDIYKIIPLDKSGKVTGVTVDSY